LLEEWPEWAFFLFVDFILVCIQAVVAKNQLGESNDVNGQIQ
jgi:hypothetical protein